MKITKRQLRQIIKEEKTKLLKEQSLPGEVIAAAEKGLAAIALETILSGAPGADILENQIYQYMVDIGFEDFEVQAALDQLADRYNI